MRLDSSAIKITRVIFYIFFGLYLVFPLDDGFRLIGVGPPGSRILVLDLFVITTVLLTFAALPASFQQIRYRVGFLPIFLLCASILYSLFRGLPVHGGLAIGEGRWYLSAILLLSGFALFKNPVAKGLRTIFLIAGSFHALSILVRYIQGDAWDDTGVVTRFAGGRESIVVAVASMYSLYDIWVARKIRRATPWLRTAILMFFLLVLIVAQTRTIFLFLPIALVALYLFVSRITASRLLRFAFGSGGLLLIVWLVFVVLAPREIEQSVENSLAVVAEAFSPTTYEPLVDPSSITGATGAQFSTAGNTYFRLLAWVQVVSSLDAYPGGWLIGLPMGSGFEFYDASGSLYIDLDPHNDYVSILSKIGIIGLAGYFLILWGYLRSAWSLRHKYDVNQLLKSPVPMLFAIIVLLLLFVSLNAEIRTYGMHFWVWLFLGFGFRSVIDFEKKNSRRIEQLSSIQ